MDLNKLKEDSNLKSTYNEYKSLYIAKRKKIRQYEIDKIRIAFKEYFELNNDFIIKESNEKITAEYQGSSVILYENEYDNAQDPSMSVHMKIKMPDGKEYNILTTIYSNKESKFPPPAKSDKEIMERDLKYYKSFIEEEIIYNFKYKVKETKKEYETMQELLKDI